MIAVALVFFVAAPMAQTTDLESRIDELEAALDLLQERIEKLEQHERGRSRSGAAQEAGGRRVYRAARASTAIRTRPRHESEPRLHGLSEKASGVHAREGGSAVSDERVDVVAQSNYLYSLPSVVTLGMMWKETPKLACIPENATTRCRRNGFTRAC
jgi:hypothetical protein